MNNDRRAAVGRLFCYLVVHPGIGPLEGGAGGTRPRTITERGAGRTFGLCPIMRPAPLSTYLPKSRGKKANWRKPACLFPPAWGNPLGVCEGAGGVGGEGGVGVGQQTDVAERHHLTTRKSGAGRKDVRTWRGHRASRTSLQPAEQKGAVAESADV